MDEKEFIELLRKIGNCDDKEQMQRVIDEHNKSQKTVTNADRIRAMSDEELAAYLADNYDGFCQNKPECGALIDTDEGIPEEKCVVCALEWLRSPALLDDLEVSMPE